MDRVCEEEVDGMLGVGVGVGVEPVLSTSYSANDVSQFKESNSVISGKKLTVPM